MTFKKYWSKKQGCAILGDSTSQGWQTLAKFDTLGTQVYNARTPLAKWIVSMAKQGFEGLTVEFEKEVHCCFCRKELPNEVSKTWGYGPYCAQVHGLPHSYTSKA